MEAKQKQGKILEIQQTQDINVEAMTLYQTQNFYNNSNFFHNTIDLQILRTASNFKKAELLKNLFRIFQVQVLEKAHLIVSNIATQVLIQNSFLSNRVLPYQLPIQLRSEIVKGNNHLISILFLLKWQLIFKSCFSHVELICKHQIMKMIFQLQQVIN
ncbi:unnamed protein product [Paramecium octaurelia]|uniref:Uncharacterized protein n=1 Tax=Paramecium octaurelia TaxID=43137 RepID=A0A8S1U4N0_PAROT|nr:unnamed protein product [Paramecium octaurelia]